MTHIEAAQTKSLQDKLEYVPGQPCLCPIAKVLCRHPVSGSEVKHQEIVNATFRWAVDHGPSRVLQSNFGVLTVKKSCGKCGLCIGKQSRI